jgi:hypothetical protein
MDVEDDVRGARHTRDVPAFEPFRLDLQFFYENGLSYTFFCKGWMSYMFTDCTLGKKR